MKAIVLHAAHRLELEDVSAPTAGPGEAIIEVAATAICGSDLHGYEGHSPRRTASIPLIMGHEFTGTIVELVAHGETDLTLGDRSYIGCGRSRSIGGSTRATKRNPNDHRHRCARGTSGTGQSAGSCDGPRP